MSIGHSLIQGCKGSGSFWPANHGTDLGGNLDMNPVFVNYQFATNNNPVITGNFRLTLASPAINAGNNNYNTKSTDLDENPRIIQNSIDMGAYEFQFSKSMLVLENSDTEDVFTDESFMETDIPMNIDIKMYPNPVAAGEQLFLNINVPNELLEVTTLELFDMLGRKIGEFKITEKASSINISKIPGTYFAKLTIENKFLKTEKIIVR